MRCSSLPSCTNSVDFANEHLNWDHTSESAKQANSWLWRGKDSDSLDTLRLALSARIPTTEAVDMPAHLSPPLIQKITKSGETPFLHVGTENAQAIRVYEKLGFKTRRTITFAIVKRE